MMSLLVVAAIVVAVALGYKTKINIGLFAIAFAYLIGAFGMGLSPSEIIAMWPLKIFFVIFSVCLSTASPRSTERWRNLPNT